MIKLRAAGARGHEVHGWLDSYHTFSFGDYYDPAHVGFRALHVINEDRVLGGQGFGQHSHRDFEILSYVLAGALSHHDALGTGSVIRPGEVQRMHLQRSWSISSRSGWCPNKRAFRQATSRRRFRRTSGEAVCAWLHRETVGTGASPYRRTPIYTPALFDDGQQAELALLPGRCAWVHVARGSVRINGQDMKAGDGAALSEEPNVRIEGISTADVLIFDLL